MARSKSYLDISGIFIFPALRILTEEKDNETPELTQSMNMDILVHQISSL